MLARFWALIVLSAVIVTCSASPLAAQECGADEPGRAEWVVSDDTGPLYRAVFTGRGGTLACVQLLNPQFERREESKLPAGVPAWLGRVGPLDMVTTWDTEFLPFSITFRQLGTGDPIERKVKRPLTAAVQKEWKAGEVRQGQPMEIHSLDPTYTLVKATEDEVVYVWPDPSDDKTDFFVEKTYRRLNGGYRLNLSVALYNFGSKALSNQPELTLYAWETGAETGGLFSPPPNVLEGLCMAGGDLEREDGSSLVEEAVNPPGEALWAAVGNRYFVMAAIARALTEARCHLTAYPNGVVQASLYRMNAFSIDPVEGARCYPDWYQPEQADLMRCGELSKALQVTGDDLFFAAKVDQAFKNARESLPEGKAELYLSILRDMSGSTGAGLYLYEFYIGPKDVDFLEEAEVGLEDTIDFWIVGILSKPMLHVLRWFHSLVPHWAFAIVMLTILVKLALLYWTQKSYSQMQRMAQLKPLMDQVKEKYGNDKERMNQEMMNLYKREKVNPLGGCLPMLLQMPVWIALYRTIYSSVELYQAPLALWIQDLSAPDPYYVLPILLGISMFGQQKLTPTTMDSAQAKMMMYFMPVMFTVIMLFLPSGLNLYIFVNTLLSLAQQYYLRRKFGAARPQAAA